MKGPVFTTGVLVHFVDTRKTQYDSLGMVRKIINGAPNTLYEVEWYDVDDVGIETYTREDLELVHEDWRFSSKAYGQD